MPKRTDIKKILLIGSGPIVIGQACEFDYSGTQACKALREEGYEVVLANSNPATIMTDPETADRVYIEPLTVEFLERVIDKERPDAVLPTVGGQTGLNLAVNLAEAGILDKYNCELIGAKLPDHKIDGMNIWPLITGESDKSPHEAYFLYYGQQLQAVRTQKWKLHLPHKYRHYLPEKAGKDGYPGPTGKGEIGYALFDMENDRNETTDVSAQHPQVVEHMKKLADQMRADLGDAGKPGPGIRPHGKLDPDDKRLQW